MFVSLPSGLREHEDLPPTPAMQSYYGPKNKPEQGNGLSLEHR
jgi:hypothetical protein